VTLQKPDDMNFYRWMMRGINLKTIIVFTCVVVGAHYAESTRITVIEQKAPDITKRLDDTQRMIEDQRNDIKQKVDRDTYENDQRKLQEQLTAIQDSQGRIESALMDGKRH
jgi:hypothetical protein